MAVSGMFCGMIRVALNATVTTRDSSPAVQSRQFHCSNRSEAMVSNRPSSNGRNLFLILSLAAAITFLLFSWQGRQGFELWDEGYFWYGAQRVLVGEVPLRDFMAYDPGRYYWAAAWMNIWNDSGIMALRAAAAIFQGIGLVFGLWIVSSETKRGAALLLVVLSVVLTAWMYPAFKVFDVVPSILLVCAYTVLVRQPSAKRYFLSGLAVGLMAVFGRNHGVYGVAGGLAVLAYLAYIRAGQLGFVRALTTWGAGIVVGFSPVLLMMAAVPGFSSAMWDSIAFLFQIKATNLALPVLWPWTVPYATLSAWEGLRGFVLGSLFIAVPLFGVIGIGACVLGHMRKQTVAPLFVASTAMALPYAHYVFSRADIVHLAQGIMPFLLGCFAIAATSRQTPRWLAATLLCGASLAVMFPVQPGWQCHISPSCVEAKVGKDRMKIEQGAVNDLAMLDTLARQYAPGDQTFIATPFWPGAYAALERRSPMWEIYALFPRDAAFQRAEIERIKAANPGFVLVLDIAIDGSDQTRFRNTHAMVFEYIRTHFESLGAYMGNPAYQVYRRR